MELKSNSNSKLKVECCRTFYHQTVYYVRLLEGNDWPTNRELLEFCDAPFGAPFGGRVTPTSDPRVRVVTVYTD